MGEMPVGIQRNLPKLAVIAEHPAVTLQAFPNAMVAFAEVDHSAFPVGTGDGTGDGHEGTLRGVVVGAGFEPATSSL